MDLKLSRSYELHPLRAGQVCVARDADQQLTAYRAFPTETRALAWQQIADDHAQRAAAIDAFCLYHNRFAAHADHPLCAVSRRQLAQLIAHRAADLALNDDAGRQETSLLAVASVITATQGSDISVALSQLASLDLDLGDVADRHALQLVINLAESNGRAANLFYLAIEAYAHAGVLHACDWLGQFCTPRMATELRSLAATDLVALRLMESTNSSYGRFDALSAV